MERIYADNGIELYKTNTPGRKLLRYDSGEFTYTTDEFLITDADARVAMRDRLGAYSVILKYEKSRRRGR